MMQDWYNVVDKSDWPPGPWQQEPDKMSWVDKETDMACLIVRNHAGALCGYVGVESTHSCYGQDYGDVDVEVHGGLTFSDKCQEHPNPGRGICHTPLEGRPDDVWWLGFDCHHYMDFGPAYGRYCPTYNGDEQYRDLPYVVSEVESLAIQLKTLY